MRTRPAFDLLAFLDALRGHRLLPRDLTEVFFTPQVRHDEQTEYGFGLEFRGPTYYKEGHNAGVSAILIHHGTTEVDAVVLSNTEYGAWPIVAELNRLFEHA